MADIDTLASPRSHSRRPRHRTAGRVRHSKQFEEFLTVQATRLSSDVATIFAKLSTYSADQVRAAANMDALP